MTRKQFLLLNGVTAILVLLMLTHLVLSRANNKAATELNTERNYVSNARQLQPAMENLVRRINASGQNDIQLKALLSKYDIKVNGPTDLKSTDSKSAEPAAKAGQK